MSLFKCIIQAPGCRKQISVALHGSLSRMQGRSFATHQVYRPLSPQKKDSQFVAGRFISGGTWQALDPSKVQPLDVLEQLKNLGKFPGLSLHTAVILATPSFSHWLHKDNDFLAKLVHRLSFGYSGGEASDAGVIVRTRSAIVDRIPSDTKLTMRSQASDRGIEGISVLLSGRALRSLRSDPGAPDGLTQNAHIRFYSQISNQEQQFIGLPVANTMFRNGRVSTLFEDIWKASTELKEGIRFERISRVPLKSFDIAICPPSSLPFVGMPMSPLTRPCEIVSSIGNVIRELKRSGTGEVFPASTDLEATVPQLLKSPWLTDTARQAFSVFALITPKGFYARSSDAVQAGIYAPGRRFLLPKLLEGQARLHRVTGGGGGWGNKKGLLSLEPGTNIFVDEDRKLPALPLDGKDYDFQSATTLASPGDNVQFFATFPGPQGPPEEPTMREDGKQETFVEKEALTVENWRSVPGRTLPRVVIGTNPPDEQYSAATNNTSMSMAKLMFLPNYFGMLSDSGACLGRTQTNALPLDDSHVSFTSRLDLPFTTLIAEATFKHGPPGNATRRVAMQSSEK